MTGVTELEKTLNIKMEDPDLLQRALVHSSYCNENPGDAVGHNERLEFLGDAVLDAVVAEKLYRDYEDMPEGEMSQRRAALVRRETLARVARGINLGDYLLMGKGEEGTGGRDKGANLAGAMEAVIAAVYLDRGFTEAREMVLRLMEDEWQNTEGGSLGIDYKSRLQEATQSRYQSLPAYRLEGESGPDHDKRFTYRVLVNGKMLGEATGKTKKAAENEAARQALESLEQGFTD